MKNNLELLMVCAIGAAIGTGIGYVVTHYVDDASAAIIALAFLVLAAVIGMCMPNRNQ